jgi:hypothetical protein
VQRIKVPNAPKKAFNPKRRPSALLLGQVAHLEWAARPAAKRQPRHMKQVLKKGKPRTEEEAAERIAALTRNVLKNAAAERERQLAESRPVAQPVPVITSSAGPRPLPLRPAKKPVRRRTRRR